MKRILLSISIVAGMASNSAMPYFFSRTERTTRDSMSSWQDVSCYIAGACVGGYVFDALNTDYHKQCNIVRAPPSTEVNLWPSNESILMGFGAGMASVAAMFFLRYTKNPVLCGHLVSPVLMTADSIFHLPKSGLWLCVRRSAESFIIPVCACAAVYIKNYNE